MKSFITCLLIYLCIAGCTPQRRLNRFIANHPELVKVDTMRFRRLYPIPAKLAIIPLPAIQFHQDIKEKRSFSVKDSITGITASFSCNADGDSIFIAIEVPEDTLKVDENIPVNTIRVTQQSIGKTMLENLPVIMLIIIIFVLVVFRKR